MRRQALLALALCWAAPVHAQGVVPPVAIGGLVQTPQRLAPAALRALPQTTLKIRFETMHGAQDSSWTGPLLWSLVNKAGLRDERGPRSFARHAILVTGRDGYAATIAMGEIDPALEGKPVLLAWAKDGEDLTELHLVVPGDKHGARDVHEVVSITVR